MSYVLVIVYDGEDDRENECWYLYITMRQNFRGNHGVGYYIAKHCFSKLDILIAINETSSILDHVEYVFQSSSSYNFHDCKGDYVNIDYCKGDYVRR